MKTSQKTNPIARCNQRNSQNQTYEGLSCAVVHPAHSRMKAAHCISLNLKENNKGKRLIRTHKVLAMCVSSLIFPVLRIK